MLQGQFYKHPHFAFPRFTLFNILLHLLCLTSLSLSELPHMYIHRFLLKHLKEAVNATYPLDHSA